MSVGREAVTAMHSDAPLQINEGHIFEVGLWRDGVAKPFCLLTVVSHPLNFVEVIGDEDAHSCFCVRDSNNARMRKLNRNRMCAPEEGQSE
ncbi:MAG: hypothetical protein GDYSWBUE_002095 [Candidatus Fervidibacterota bacterium]